MSFKFTFGNEEMFVRVNRGATHLDEVNPGWAWDIRPNYLIMSSPCNCILGQLYGLFSDGLAELFGSDGEKDYAWRGHGFSLDHGNEAETWDMLEECWMNEISERTHKGAQA